jgi:hypothetical protein
MLRDAERDATRARKRQLNSESHVASLLEQVQSLQDQCEIAEDDAAGIRERNAKRRRTVRTVVIDE